MQEDAKSTGKKRGRPAYKHLNRDNLQGSRGSSSKSKSRGRP